MSATPYTVAAATADITPQNALPTLASRGVPASRIADRLELNIVVLGDSATRIAFLSFDSLSAGNNIRSRLLKRFQADLRAERLFLAATHTHFAPALDPDVPAFKPSLVYLNDVSERAAAALGAALSAMPTPVQARYSEGKANHAIHRRKSRFVLRRALPPWKRIVEMRPNFSGEWDETIRVLTLREKDGTPAAVIWGYSCHPVCSPDRMAVSGDFPAAVRKELRRQYGDIPVVFLQGFSGDVRPRAVRPRFTARNILRPLAFSELSPNQWESWSGSLAERVSETMEAGENRAISGAISASRWGMSIRDMGPTGDNELFFQEVRMGDDLSIFGISAEVLNAYTGIVRDVCRARSFMPVGCIDSIAGYLPTSEAVKTGGYEAERSMGVYGLSGRFRSDISTAISAAIERHHAKLSSSEI